jgi:hypothetical protein
MRARIRQDFRLATVWNPAADVVPLCVPRVDWGGTATEDRART